MEIPILKPSPKKPPRRTKSKKPPEDFKILLEKGLQSPGSRNEAFLKLARYFIYFKGYEKDKARQFMRKWIAEKHNGMSKDWNRNPKLVYRKIDDVLKNFDLQKIGDSFPHHLLSEEDKRKLVQISNELDIAIEWLLDLAAYIKKNTKEDGLVEIPFQVFRDCRKGATSHKYSGWKKKLLEGGYLEIIKSYSVYHGKCRAFKSKLL